MKCGFQNAKIGLFYSLLYHDSLFCLALQVDHVFTMHYFIVLFLTNTYTLHYMMSKNIFVNTISDLIRKFKYWEAVKLAVWIYSFQNSNIHLKIFSSEVVFPDVKVLTSFIFIAKCPNMNSHTGLSIVLSRRNSFTFNNQLEQPTI